MYMGPVQSQTKPNPTMESGAHYKVPSLARALLIILGYWERKGEFPLRMWPLINYHIPVEGHTYKNLWTAQIGLDGEK